MDEISDVDERTVWCGNLSDKVSEDILYELFLQAGPIERIRIPNDQGRQCSYGFITFQHACSCDYAIEIFIQTKLFGRLLNIQRRSRTNTNGQEAILALQNPNSLISNPNMQYMLPQHMMPVFPPSPDRFAGQEVYYTTPQNRGYRKSPPRRSPPRHRYEHRSHKHYEPKSNRDDHNHGRHRKRHKR